MRFLGGCVDHKRERKRWSPAGSVCVQRTRFRWARLEIVAFCASAPERGRWKMLEIVVHPRTRCDNGELQTGPALTCYGSGRDHERGPPMRGTYRVRALATFRDAVAERVRGGEPFGAVEDAIDEIVDLTQDQKAALWLYAFSLRSPLEQQLDARAHLASLS